MATIDLLIDDARLKDELIAAVAGDGVIVGQVTGKSAGLSGAEFDHIIQIVVETVFYDALKRLLTGLKDALAAYLDRKPEGFDVVVDGISFRVNNRKNLDDVLTAIAEAEEKKLKRRET